MGFISAKIIYQRNEFVGCVQTALINSALVVGTPRQAWIAPNIYGYWTLTFKDPQVPQALTGIWVTEAGTDGEGALIDGSLSDVQAGLSACCSSTPVVIAPFYNGVFPPLTAPVPATYTYTRTDDGSVSDLEDFLLAYARWVIPNTIQRSSYSGGVSTYVFQSYTAPTPQGNDSQTGATARIFTSNVPAALTGGQTYTFRALVNGDPLGPDLTGMASLAAIVTAANASTAYNAAGTYSSVGGAIQLSSTTVTNAYMTVTVVG